MKESRGPLIFAIVVLLLPMLYVASYFALVTPFRYSLSFILVSKNRYEHYRWGGAWSERIYWPLEKVDRLVRRKAWATPHPNDPFDAED